MHETSTRWLADHTAVLHCHFGTVTTCYNNMMIYEERKQIPLYHSSSTYGCGVFAERMIGIIYKLHTMHVSFHNAQHELSPYLYLFIFVIDLFP